MKELHTRNKKKPLIQKRKIQKNSLIKTLFIKSKNYYFNENIFEMKHTKKGENLFREEKKWHTKSIIEWKKNKKW